MNSFFKFLIVTAALFSPTLALADPLSPAQVPADSTWVIHLDADAIRKSTTWKLLYERLQKNMDFQTKIQEIEAIMNARFPDDLHGVTLAGAAFGDSAGVVLIHAKVDRQQLEQGLAINSAYATEPRGAQSLLTWDDKGKLNYGGFFSDTQFIVGQDKQRVAALFDTLAGKAPAIKPDASLQEGAGKGVLVYIAGEELAKLRQAQQAKSPLLAQMKSAWIGITEAGDDLVLTLNVTANDAATADKMKRAAEGMRAAVSLAADEPDAKPGVKLIADLTADAVATVKNNQVSVEFRIPQKKLPGLIDQAITAKEAEEKAK